MLIYLVQYLSDFFASSSYTVAKKYYSEVFYSSTEIFAYGNIYVIIFFILINPILKKKYGFSLFKFKEYWHKKHIVYATLMSVLGTYVKTLILSNIFNVSQLELRGYSMLAPFITVLFCHFNLKDQRLNKIFVVSFLISVVGFIIFNAQTQFLFTIAILPAIYTLLVSYADYRLKAISRERTLEMIVFDNLMFVCVSVIVFTIAGFNENFTASIFGIKKFSLSKISNPHGVLPLLAVASLSFFAHNFKMLSFKAKHITGIVIFGIIFKCFNSSLMTYIEIRKLPTILQSIGLMVMFIGLAIFVYKNARKSKDFVLDTKA
jgi:hypothetical protein